MSETVLVKSGEVLVTSGEDPAKSAAIIVAATTGGVMTGIGFTSSGIAATSTAAGIKAGIGSVAAGSLGASGVFYALGLTGGIGLGVLAIYGGYKLL
jgi:hypothetical protein